MLTWFLPATSIVGAVPWLYNLLQNLAFLALLPPRFQDPEVRGAPIDGVGAEWNTPRHRGFLNVSFVEQDKDALGLELPCCFGTAQAFPAGYFNRLRVPRPCPLTYPITLTKSGFWLEGV